MSRDMSEGRVAPVTDCCGVKIQMSAHDGGARESCCNDCGADVCSSCAPVYTAEDGYGDDGQGVRTFALCASCHGEREYKRQRREQRNDSGV